MTHSATITIKFTDYWLSSTGGSGKGDLDMVCHRDTNGCPALPMTQVKGMLRETAERMLPPKCVVKLFGERETVSTDKAKNNLPKAPPKEGSLRFSGDALMSPADRAWFAKMENKDKRAALFARLRSTAITETGVAQTNSLRTAEVAMPLELTGRIDWTGRDTPPENWIETLNQLCKLTFAFGHGKNDGLGRAIASCAEFNCDIDAAATLIPSDNRLVIDLEPEDVAVFSRANANEGQQLSHAGPTGASLWGWAIGQLKGDPVTLKALLSGKISFSDAVPLIDDATPAFMRPAVLFSPKQAKAGETPPIDKDKDKDKDKGFHPSALRIGMKAYREDYNKAEDRQPQAFAPLHMSLALDGIAPVGKGHRLRSGHKDGKAEDKKLFGYQHIAPKITKYRAVIEAPGGFPDGLVEVFQHRLFLGKARNNGYGGGYKVTAAPGADFLPAQTIPNKATIARIWCLSDMALYDDWGRLNVEPCAAEFGLPKSWKLCRTESAVTTRRYAPWDSAIQGHESEILVVEAGSVLAFVGAALEEAITLPARKGDYGARGCGWIALVPEVMPDKAKDIDAPSQTPIEVTDNRLIGWAAERIKERDTRALDKWVACAQSCTNGLRKSPSKTQWSKVKLDGAETELRIDQGWDCKVGDISLKDWLIAEAKSHSEKEWPEAHRRMARKRLVDHARRKAPSAARDDR